MSKGSMASSVGYFGTTVLADALVIKYSNDMRKNCECGFENERMLVRNLAIVDLTVNLLVFASSLLYNMSFERMTQKLKKQLNVGFISISAVVFLFKVVFAYLVFSYLLKTSSCTCAMNTLTDKGIRVYSYVFFGLQLVSAVLLILALIAQLFKVQRE